MNRTYHALCTRLAIGTLAILLISGSSTSKLHAEFQAGAVITDVTPTTLPVLVNGGMTSRTTEQITTRLNARALALSDGQTRIVIVVVDSCMMPRPLLDEAKSLASRRTGIPTDHMLISATHTHTAGACMGALGTPADENYVALLKAKLADTIVAAVATLQPARIGFARTNAAEFTAVRRWIRRPDRIAEDPFGNLTVRANMHAGRNWDDVTGESGPEDPELSLISVQAHDGTPIAVLANFSMHYFSGQQGISADYFGRFSEGLKERLAPDSQFVGIMSHGCSGDIWRRDYTRPDTWDDIATIDQYAHGLLEIALAAYQDISYRDDVDLAMVERRMTLKYRVPDQQRLQWAERIVAEMGDRLPKTREEVYALEQIILHERQQTEVVVQALRVGDIGIATTPNETYAITGLKIKAASPLPKTMVIELANGGDGYIPPPAQHQLGGYNTWAARSAGLEVAAEPRIAEACISLLEKVSGQTRRPTTLSRGPEADAIGKLKPAAWYRLDEFAGPRAVDSSGNHRDAIYEPQVAYYLEGPLSHQFCDQGQTNRAAMFAGGRLRSCLPSSSSSYSVSLWIWNGMPTDGRDVTGWFLSRGYDNGVAPYSEHLGIGGMSGHAGRLIFQSGADRSTITAGATVIPRWSWQHVVYVRDGTSVRVYLNGQLEIETQAADQFPRGLNQLFVGGRSDNQSNWEGRLDEVAIFDRPLDFDEVSSLAPRQAASADGGRMERPNVVFVLADDLGWTDVNCFDPLKRGFYETPNIDRLATQGMKFMQAYSSGANCSPTRAALLSGQYYPRQPIYHVGTPSRGLLIPAKNGQFLPSEKIVLAEALKQADYATAFIGKWHIGSPPETGPLQQGYDVNIGGYHAGNPGAWQGAYLRPDNNPYIDDAQPNEYLTDYLTRKAISFIENNKDRPFYLQLSYYTPHSPFQAPAQRIEKYREKTGTGGHQHAAYAAMIESLDRGVGRLMETLNRLNLARNTIFVFYSDNGGRGGYRFLGHADNDITSNAPLKSGKGSFYEGGIRVPLIVRWPARIMPGTACDEPVISIDWYPTLLEAAGLEQPGEYILDGVSLMPLLAGVQESLDRDALYWHFPGYPNARWRTSPVSVIRSGSWKLMKFYETGELQLYNLAEDLSEQQNLADAMPQQRDMLHRQLTNWLESHDAPLPRQRN